MAKTKTPFLSLGAKGSVGGSITAQSRPHETLVRQKPFPTDPYSLSQAYQRWLYQDYAYLWTQQSAATQAEYRSAGVRHHLTGFQYWMKTMLSTLPDIVGWWTFDINTQPTTPDRSLNNQPFTVVGASPIDGGIDGAFLFDGLNDFLWTPQHDRYNLTPPYSLECLMKSTAGDNRHMICKLWGAVTNYPYDLRERYGVVYFIVRDGGVNFILRGVIPIQDGLRHHILITVSATTITNYVDGVFDNSIPFIYTAATANTDVLVVGDSNVYTPGEWDGSIDNVILYGRLLDQADALRHSARRYPA